MVIAPALILSPIESTRVLIGTLQRQAAPRCHDENQSIRNEYDAGYSVGYDTGWDDGWEEGHIDGIADGYKEAYSEGYDAGYDACFDDMT